MPIPAGFAQATWQFSGAALPYGAVVTAGVDLGGAPPAPIQVAEDLFSAFGNTIMGQLVADVVLTGCLVKFGPDATGPSAVFSGAIAGSQVNDGSPAQVAFLIRKNTALGGRSGRGRWYVPGVRETSVDEAGNLLQGSIDLMQAEVDDFLIAVGAANLNLVILHQADAPIQVPTALTGMQVDSRVATQRRRLRR